jgi:2-desacetyl-2-hydroxyethyl bacteriochlorophyllide A dehydrogenase
MKAAVVKEARKMVVEDVPDPEVGPGEVVVKVKYVGICGSDLHLYSYGFLPSDYVMGHEATGTIVSVGDGVEDWKEGDRVLLIGGSTCHECDWCQKYDNRFCRNPRSIGVGDLPGAYAEYIKVPTQLLVRLSDDDAMMEPVLMDPLGCAHNGVIRSGVTPEETALVVGGGPIGLFAVQYLNALGVEQVILSEPVERRAKLGGELGADVVLDPTSVNIDQEVKKLTDGLGPEVVLECVGVPSTTLESVGLVRHSGKVVWVGVCMEEISFRPAFWMLKNISIELIMGFGRANKIADYLQFIQDKQEDVRKTITEIISLDAVPDAFERLLTPNTEVKVMVEFD